MKKLFFLLLTACLLVGAVTGCSDDHIDEPEIPVEGGDEIEDGVDTDFHIYLCFGQSNMEGAGVIEDTDKTGGSDRFKVMAVASGDKEHLNREAGQWYKATPPLCRWDAGLTPVDYFGRNMVERTPENIKVGVVVVAMGGSGIDAFNKDTYKTYYENADAWQRGLMDVYGGNPYAKLVEMGKEAQKSGVIKGILLHQGESNNMQEDWPQKVNKIYTDLLNDLGLEASNVPLLAGEMLYEDQGGVCWGMNNIIAKLPDVIPNAYVISANGCSGVDEFHFTSEGYRELGKRYAKQMLDLLDIDEKRVLPTLYVDGRYMRNYNGQIVNLHGFAQTYSPFFNNSGWTNYDANECLRYNKGIIDKMLAAGWAFNFFRLHMDPYWSNIPGCAGRYEGHECFSEERFRNALDNVFIPMAEFGISRGLHVVMRPPGVCPEIIATGDDYNEYLLKVWESVSSHPRIKNNPNIMFELANEPIHIIGSNGVPGGNGQECFDEMKKFFQPIVDVIRRNTDNIIWVPGLGYQSQYSGFANNPITGVNIGYAVHLYPGWMGSEGTNGDGGSGSGGYEPFQRGWDAQVKPVADMAPILITEMDWAPEKYNASWGKGFTGTPGGDGFGANFKYITDNAGNVSWLLFTDCHLLAEFEDVPGIPGEYTFLNDPEACPWPIYHWFKEYANGSASTGVLQELIVEGVNNNSIDVLTGSDKYVIVKAIYEDGSTEIVTNRASYISTDPSIVTVENNGRIKGVKDGNATIHITYMDTWGNSRTINIAVHSTTFPLTNDGFNPSIWENGSFDENTNTLITGQWGFGGWQYSNGVDLSGYRYLIAELGNDNESQVSFRLFDENSYWSSAAAYDFGNSRQVRVDLHDMYKEVNGQAVKLDPSHIYIIGFWSSGGKPIIINNVYLTN